MNDQFACVSCGTKTFTTLYKDLPDLQLDNVGSYRTTLVRCDSCGLVAHWPMPTDAELASFYPDSYAPYHANGRSGQSLRNRLRRRYFTGTVSQVLQYRMTGRILDVGCSNGAFLCDMQALGGWQCVGIEIGHSAVQAARAHGLTVYEMNLNQIEERPELGGFDVITMWDVLEHVRNPVDVMRRLGTMLADDGILIIGVPNIASWEATLFGSAWSGLDAPRHLHLFDPKTLAEASTTAGFEVLTIKNGSGLYSTFVNTLMFALRQRGASAGTTRTVGRTLRNFSFRCLGEPLVRAVSARGRASKMVAVVRRHRSAA